VIISVGNWEIAIKVQEQERPETAERIHRQRLQERQIERDRDMAYARLFLGRGNQYRGSYYN
jgi:hypothetical protein